MRTGETFSHYSVGPQIGQGGFGKIFAARDTNTGLLYALKNESTTAERKTLKFETEVLRRIQNYPAFPFLFDNGEDNHIYWSLIELCGPSLASILKKIPNHIFSFSTGIRASMQILSALRDLHSCGFLHRDIKPSNVLVRITKDKPPLCLIDFGLARVYRDQTTNRHIPPRKTAGFRGTKTYASLRSHQNQDLSRRDDLISWFYFTIDIITGLLPWKNSKEDVIKLKSEWDVDSAVAPISHRLKEIWDHINSLGFEDDPNYAQYAEILNEICKEAHIREIDPYDWEPYVQEYSTRLASEFGVALRIDSGGSVQSFRSELGLPPTIYNQMGITQSLLPPQKPMGHMELSELNERDHPSCCC